MPRLSHSHEAVRSAPLLRGLDSQAVQEVLSASAWQERADGEFFFMEGAPAERAYMLVEGRVKLVQITPDGQQVLLGYLVAGQTFGIIAVLEEAVYPVSAQAVGVCRAVWWGRGLLSRLLEQHPRLALNALHIMAEKVRLFQRLLQEISTQQVEQRIARAVLRLANQVGRKVDGGVLLDMPLSRQDLAEMTGTTLYTVSRVLKDWQKRGLVEPRRMNILIRQPHGLVVIAEGLLPRTRP